MTSPAPSTLSLLLAHWADRTPRASAVLAPGRRPLDYAGLQAQVDAVRAHLLARGIGRNDRVALVLPQGPEAGVGFLAIAASATCAPLNPAYQAPEFEFYLGDLRAAGLVIAADLASPAREVARSLQVPVIELTALTDGAAGTFRLSGDEPKAAPGRQEDPARPEDVALVLHTSGTTSRPKIVPLTQANLCRSADNIARTLALGPSDRCLDVATLFHIHGLMVMVASWAAGGSVICPPPFEASRFFAWLEECRATWYSAVPTVHQAILAQAESRQQALAAALRFIRSSSASLPPPVIAGLERAFDCPVIESYGMTEAAHQMASNPLPPAARKPGSVGRPAGPEIVILGEAGERLAPGAPGEIAIRGANVMAGYENNAPANAAAFTDGWLRTGDQGYLDADGYLFISGRLKEIINRGGEKIGPREVDEVLLEHPAVAQAVTFPLPHPTLGEDVAAAIVPRAGTTVTAAEIRAFAATRLALTKVPNRVVLVQRIPTGATGKFQRRLLAEQLGLMSSASAGLERAVTAPRDPLEYRLVEIWERLFERQPIGITDDFFDLGGYSLLAARMMEEIARVCGPTLPPSTLFGAPSIEALARAVRARLAQPVASQPRPLVELQRGGTRPPFVFLNGDLYGGGFYCRGFVAHMHPEQPFYTLSSHGLDGDPTPPSIEAMATAHLETLRAFQPEGPYLLGGFSHASLVAFEMAQQLRRGGQTVALLVLVDGPVADPRLRPLRAVLDGVARARGRDAAQRAEAFIAWRRRLERAQQRSRGGWGSLARFVLAKAGTLIGSDVRPPAPPTGLPTSQPVLDERRRRIMETYTRITGRYVPRRYPGPATLLVSSEGAARAGDATLGWRRVIEQLSVVAIPGDHLTCVTKYGHVVGEHLRACLDAVTAAAPALVLAEGERR
jgi:acyl-CoA synthetase (AMP-forming)/AMP-acid ligase II/thioesterase domain-containing protein